MFNQLRARCAMYEREGSELVFARMWDYEGSDIMVRITKRDILHQDDHLTKTTLRTAYTMTCAFTVNGKPTCSIDVLDGSAEDCFERLADRTLLP